MGIKKRVSALLLAVSLSFGVCATDYLEVQALEWAGVTIGLDTALKFLLGLVGVSVGVGVADSIDWTETREQCITFQQNQGNSAVAVSNWWADVIRGKLDTASDCWQSFKEWVKNDLLSGSSSGGGSGSTTFDGLSYSECIQYLNDYFNISISENSNFSSYTIYAVVVLKNSSNYYFIRFFVDDTSYSDLVTTANGIYTINNNRTKHYFSWNNGSYSSGTSSAYFQLYTASQGSNYLSDSISFDDSLGLNNTYILDMFGSTTSDSDFDASFENVTDIGLGSSIATDLPQEGVLDIPWENVGDTAESVDGAIDNALENVNSGTWTLDQYWEYVQNITNVYAYDITNNYLLPNDGNNETTEDKVQENVSRGAFVLAGLEKVFPFCIPWDIYAFVTLLVADPVAPVIEYPVYNPVTDSEEIIIIDFSVWEDQVVIMRYIFDFLLIIGLLLLARSLIGAGGSD